MEYRKTTGSDDHSWHGDTFKVVFALHDFHRGLDYRTIVGSGNPQTLIWRSKKGWRRPVFDSMEAISRLTYFDLLEWSEVLRECSEDEAIEFCLGALRPRSKSVDSKSVMIAIDLVERAVVDSSVLRGCNLERPRTSETSEDTHLLVSGWAVGKDAPVARVDVTTAGTTLEWIPVIRERPDIAKAFPDVEYAGYAGFLSALTLPVGPFSLDLVAELANGARHPIGKISGTAIVQ